MLICCVLFSVCTENDLCVQATADALSQKPKVSGVTKWAEFSEEQIFGGQYILQRRFHSSKGGHLATAHDIIYQVCSCLCVLCTYLCSVYVVYMVHTDTVWCRHFANPSPTSR